ncbi:MAG: hypothetical protein ABF289_05980 [Clostridiales bacterium]
MDILKKLPLILSFSMTISVGFISNIMQLSNKTIYIRMIIILITFYILGIYLRNILTNIINEVDSSKKSNEDETPYDERDQNTDEGKNNLTNDESDAKGSSFNATTEDEDFSPDELSKLISENLDE